jgi:hypothetical protein
MLILTPFLLILLRKINKNGVKKYSFARQAAKGPLTQPCTAAIYLAAVYYQQSDKH